MDFIRTIQYELISKSKQILIKIDEIDESNMHIFDVIDSERNITVKIITPMNYSFICLKFMLHRIIMENGNYISNIILSSIFKTMISKLNEITIRLLKTEIVEPENGIVIHDVYANDPVIPFKDLTDEEKWIIIFSEQLINFKKSFGTYNFDDCKIELYNKFKLLFERFISLRQKNIRSKLKLIENNETRDVMINHAWSFFKNQSIDNQKIIYLKTTSELTLKKLSDELDKFLYGVSNHQTVALLLSQMLKIIPSESYSSVVSTTIPFLKNNRITPALEERTYQIYSKSLNHTNTSTIDFIVMMLFRSCGIVITQSALTNIFVSLLYSGYPLDLNMKEYIYKLFHNNNIVTLSNLITLYRDFRNNTIFVLLVNHQNIIKELSNGLVDESIQLIKNENLPRILEMRNLMIINLTYYILSNPKYSSIFKIKYVKTLTSKLTTIVSCLPIEENKVKPIVDILMKCYFKTNQNGQIDIKSFMNLLRDNLIKSYYEDVTDYSQVKFVLSSLIDDSKSKELDVMIIFKEMLFGNFVNNCELCDNLYLICQNHCNIMACKSHKICIDCYEKIYDIKVYKQGQPINVMNFVCPICREPEPNKIYKIPNDFYQSPEKHCLCSYPDCMNIAKMTNLPPCQAAGLVEEDNNPLNNNDEHENYCEQHLNLMRLMAYVPVEMINSVKECPSCHSLINRVEGCSHITCQCGQQFCWVCDYIHQDNRLTYSHASYCRGNHTWEKALSLLSNVSTRILNEIKTFYENLPENEETNEIMIARESHQLIEEWLSNDLASPEINAQSFWNFQSWLNNRLGGTVENIIPQLIAEICEWIHSPTTSQTTISVIASSLKQELLKLKAIDERLFAEL